MNYKETAQNYIKSFERFLKDYMNICKNSIEINLFNSMQYSLFSGGKRVRPLLVLAMYELCGGKSLEIYKFAGAVEMIHTYSLIHDDLPCMDDDKMRRGKPCNHIAFGESTALLAGDALLTHAFQLASSTNCIEISPENIIKAVNILACNAGSAGMVSGQVMDLNINQSNFTKETLEKIYFLKTSALITASVKIGAILAGADDEKVKLAENYGKNIGLAFQLIDDILDEETENLKFFGGEKGAFETVKKLTSDAKSYLEKIGENSDFLKKFADYLMLRIS